MIIRIKLMNDRAIIPRQSAGDSGADLYACCSATVQPGRTIRVDTGIAVAIPDGMTGLVLPRSGLGARGYAVKTGVIDPSYRGPIGVIAHNTTDWPWAIKAGDRIAQLVIVATPVVTLDAVSDLDSTERGDKGFGSTGR
jgi:dUTP pyrophosphatase